MQLTGLLTMAFALAFVAAAPTPAEPETSPVAGSPEETGLIVIKRVCPSDFTSTGVCEFPPQWLCYHLSLCAQ